MNSTPSMPASIIRLTALQPPPPMPMTRMDAPNPPSSNDNVMSLFFSSKCKVVIEPSFGINCPSSSYFLEQPVLHFLSFACRSSSQMGFGDCCYHLALDVLSVLQDSQPSGIGWIKGRMVLSDNINGGIRSERAFPESAQHDPQSHPTASPLR